MNAIIVHPVMYYRKSFAIGIILRISCLIAALPVVGVAQDTLVRAAATNNGQVYEARAERGLLEKANAERAKAGAPPLTMDESLVRAAREHSSAMAAHKEISHRFVGEPALMDRIAAVSTLHVDTVAENVAFADSVDAAHQALMTSAGHRANLLNPKFNIAGFGILRQGDMLFVTEDFARSLEIYTPQRMQQIVADALQQLRVQGKKPRLEIAKDRALQSTACEMARADSLQAAHVSSGNHLLLYTTMDAHSIPDRIAQLVLQNGGNHLSLGACYARSQQYPGGAYWVALVLH